MGKDGIYISRFFTQHIKNASKIKEVLCPNILKSYPYY